MSQVAYCFPFSIDGFVFLMEGFCYRGGLRGRELVNTVGKVMLQGGGSFGTFLAIGSGLRC